MERDFSKKIDEDDLLVHILTNIEGDDYDNVIEKYEDKIGAANNPETLTEVQDALQSRFQRLQRKALVR